MSTCVEIGEHLAGVRIGDVLLYVGEDGDGVDRCVLVDVEDWTPGPELRCRPEGAGEDEDFWTWSRNVRRMEAP